MPKTFQIYVLLFSLYWAQGLPVGFMTHALPVILRMQGVSLAHIGGFGLLLAPWAIKILWAPWVDAYGKTRIGHYRSWIIPAQFLTVILLVLLSFLPIQALNQPIYLFAFFVSMLCINTIGATQDIATDALAVYILKGEQQHYGNMFQVVGSRLGFIVGGGAILWSLDWLSWQPTFLILAILVLLNTLPVLFYREVNQERVIAPSESKPHLLIQLRGYLSYFSQSVVLIAWLFVLCSIKVADGLSGPLLKPLMVDLGLSLSEIGIYVTMLGAVAALLGAGLASVILHYIKRSTALLLFSIFKILSLGGYLYLARLYRSESKVEHWLIYIINALEDMFAAMLLVVTLTLVMQYSRKAFAGTDFTLQVSIMTLISGGLYSLSGIIADALGYVDYLTVILVIGVVLLLPLYYWKYLADRSE
nr:MFS transporter [Acinetobacter sp. Marseille-Q1620]